MPHPPGVTCKVCELNKRQFAHLVDAPLLPLRDLSEHLWVGPIEMHDHRDDSLVIGVPVGPVDGPVRAITAKSAVKLIIKVVNIHPAP